MSSNRVYSTDQGRICPDCNQPVKQCRCSKKNKAKDSSPAAKGDGIVRVQRETKGRKGSGVTLVTGLELEAGELKKLAKTLKQRCSSGGAIKNGIIEIQGDHRETVKTMLEDAGFKVKLAGG